MFGFWLDLLITLGLALIALYYYAQEKYTFFAKRGIPFDPPVFLLGNIYRILVYFESGVDVMIGLYKKFPTAPVVGFYQGLKPCYLIKDPEVVHRVMIKDFSHFHDRGLDIDEEVNPLEGHLFNMSGTKWKTLRNKLTPTFTSGKLRGMLPLMDVCVDAFNEHLDTLTDQELDIKELFSRLTTDVIGSCAFGIDSGAIKNPENEFMKMGKSIFSPDAAGLMKFFFRFFFPALAHKLKLKTIPDNVHNFFFNITKQNFDLRLKSGQKRNDFVQLLLELREKGEVKVDAIEQVDEDDAYLYSAPEIDHQIEDNGKLVIDDGLLTAQAFVFLVAGFETSATSLCFIAYLLSKNQSVQEKLREEIRTAKEKYGQFSYEALKSMKYLDACINEGMRIYPPFGLLFRKCNKDLLLGDGLQIEQGHNIMIPIMAIHNDPEIFPQPEVFRPERFLESTPSPGTFMPFGEGPRVCIAQRFALLEVKLALAKMLDRYKIETCPKMAAIEPIRLDPRTFVTTSSKGIFVKIKKLEK